eukprot:CAMPEP_0197618376 /NCGR_PEP_ID=MMETSP1326-20131121/61506_1 /TAXON_ID=1155430 /ORGANISM="Genus nov. species nov., Strain RCC2288" /LENGTH=235 /DNA_ID=CAMNT_0043187275 /DNA_START=212 /DNA_END=919 /DNA_ORIENTATION=-
MSSAMAGLCQRFATATRVSLTSSVTSSVRRGVSSAPRGGVQRCAAVVEDASAPAPAPAPAAEGSEEEVTLKDVTRKLMDCRKRKAAANAVDLLVSLGRAGIQPDLMASTACLGACVAAGKMDLAIKVFEEVFEKGVVVPDEVVFTELIRGHLASDPVAWARATGVLNRMPQYSVTPTALTYNLLLAKCADDNQYERAEELIDRMAEAEVEPDKWTLGSVKKRRSIRSYAKKVLLL